MRSVVTQADWKAFLNQQSARFLEKRKIKKFLNVSENPIFKHCFMRPFVSENPQGSGVILIDERKNLMDHTQAAWICFPKEFSNSVIKNTFLKEAKHWLAARSIKTLQGPIDFLNFFHRGLSCSEEQAQFQHHLISLVSQKYSESHLLQLEKKIQLGELQFSEIKKSDLLNTVFWSELIKIYENSVESFFFKPEDWIYFIKLHSEIPRSRCSFMIEYDQVPVGYILSARVSSKHLKIIQFVVLKRFESIGIRNLVEIEIMRRARAMGYQVLETEQFPIEKKYWMDSTIESSHFSQLMFETIKA